SDVCSSDLSISSAMPSNSRAYCSGGELPPYFLPVEPSAWRKASKIRRCLSGGMPGPVSATEKWRCSGWPPSGSITGLGLAISSRLVELMDGRMWGGQPFGRGKHIHFTAQFGTVPDAEPAAAAPAAMPADPIEQENLAILLAEDNVVNQKDRKILLLDWIRWHG